MPPTDVTHGLESGKPAEILPAAAWLSPSSPEAKYTPMPSAAACWNTAFIARISPRGASDSGRPQLFETMLAR